MVDHLAHARKLRARAEECRRLSKLVTEANFRSHYLALAESYEGLASHEEVLSGMTPSPPLTPPDLDPPMH